MAEGKNNLIQLAAPDLSRLSQGGSNLLVLESFGFSADGKTVLVRATFLDDGTGGTLHYGLWTYDLVSQSYTACLNELLAPSGVSASEVEVVSATLVGSGAAQTIVAQSALRSAPEEFGLAIFEGSALSDGALLASFGLDSGVRIERYSLSADARFLALQTDSEKLASDAQQDTNELSDIYLLDLLLHQVTRVSYVGNDQVLSPVRLGNVYTRGTEVEVAFSTAAAFVATDKNSGASSVEAQTDAYLWSSSFDVSGVSGAASFRLISKGTDGKASGYVSLEGEVQATAAGVYFSSNSADLVAGDSNATSDVFISASTGVVQRLSLNGINQLAQGAELLSASSSGRFVSFLSSSPEVAGSNGLQQGLVLDVQSGAWQVASANAAGTPANDLILKGALSPNGAQLAFTTAADNLTSTPAPAPAGSLFVQATSVANINDSPTGSVTITGTATQGQTLTAANTLADIDGIPESGVGAISYQWSADGTVIANATGSTYVLTQAEVGKAISVTASYTDQQGTAESKTSSATASVANINDAPTGSVTISGTASQGQTLTAANTLADIDGIPVSGVGAIIYQWSAGGAVIANATGSTYVLTQAEVGKAISVTASYADQQGTAESKTSSATASVANINDSPTGGLTITGTATQGQTLTAANTLADVDGIPESGIGAIIYQWSAGGTAIANATGITYVLTQAEVGKAITVTASYTDQQGTAESKASDATSAVANVNDSPTGVVTITGTATQGQTLTAGNTLADIDGIPESGVGAIGYQWQWSTDGNMPWTSIDGTLGDALKLSSAHLGHHIRVLGSYTDEQGLLEAVASHAVLITLDANFVAYSWKAHTLLAGVDLTAGTHSSSTDPMGAASFKAITQSNLSLSASRTVPADEAQDTTNAVNLQDAIAILKMIVGLNVNGANQPLSPYQALAADFDGNSRVELNDAIGVLKHVVGLTGTGTPKPEWRFVDEASAAVVAIKGNAALSPGQPPAINLDLTGADATVQVGLVGYLRGDVDGSFAGAAGALDLDDAQPGYFTALVAEQPALNLAQFGIYGST
jgi:hypothetical protein